jgi:hypothetical protein
MHHQAIIFYGSSPGTGKSTLSSFCFEQLTLHEIPVLWVYEDDVLSLPYFAEFVADIQSGNPKMMESLLQATSAFVQQCLTSNQVAITDSIFPCTNWLIATGLYAYADLARFSVELEQLLAPLRPLVIYLEADSRIALLRAIQQRGEEWLQGLTAALNSYGVNREHPLESFDDVVGYFQRQGEVSLKLLERWSSDLWVFDAVQMPVEQIKTTILSRLDLHEKPSQSSITAEDMDIYLGVYRSEDPVPITNPLVIGVEHGRLHVNTYWPNGCPLMAEGDALFRLENTSHCIRFEMQPDDLPDALIYITGGKHYRFKRLKARSEHILK